MLSVVVVGSLLWVLLVFNVSLDVEVPRFTILFLFYHTAMCGLVMTSELDVWKVSMRGQLKHGCQSGKRIGI